jgi:chemotaxis signal transduction protein
MSSNCVAGNRSTGPVISKAALRIFGKHPDGCDMGFAKNRTQTLLTFDLSGLNCSLPLETVREIVPMAQLVSPPGIPSGLAGFLDLRGMAIPVVLLDRLFNLRKQHAGLYTPIIILHGALNPIGILVNSVRGIVMVDPAQILAIPQDQTFQGCATGTFQLEDDVFHLLSPTRLLQANEDRLLADYRALSLARVLELEERR